MVPRCFIAAGLFCLLVAASFAQQVPPILTTSAINRSALPALTQHELIVSYWTAEAGWHSELQLRNNRTVQDLTVTPVLRTAEGEEFPLPPVTVKPREVSSLDLSDAIQSTAPQLMGKYGSLALRYTSAFEGSLYAALMVHDEGHPIAFHIDASGELDNYETASREGVWWLPKDTTNDYLIVTNQGKRPLSATLSLYDANGREAKQQVTLGSRQMARLSVRQLVKDGGLSGSYGGIKISAAAHAGSLDTLHVLFDETAGFSALLKMFDHDPNVQMETRDYAKTHIWTTHAPMLALTNPDPALLFPLGTTLHPQIFVRNTTNRAVQATLHFHWRRDAAAGSAAGPALSLRPNETRRVDVSVLEDGKTLPKDAHWASVSLTTSSQPESVMAVAASYDETLRYGAQTPFSDQLSGRWEGGEWQYDGLHDSIITAGNGGTKPIRAAFSIYYNRGAGAYELEQQLQPDEQMWVDVGQLIRNQVPDKSGKTLPIDLASGSYEFRDLTNPAAGTLFEGKVIYDKKNGHVAYGCARCCGYGEASFNFNPLDLASGGGFQQGIGAYATCTEQVEDVTNSFNGSWKVANTGIATVSVSGYHNGMSAGDTTSSSFAYLYSENTHACPLMPRAPSGGDHVAVCPTGFGTPSAEVETLDNALFTQGIRTGVGTFFSFPALGSGNLNGVPIQETLALKSTTCNSSVAKALAGLCVATGGLGIDYSGRSFDGATHPGQPNVMFDEHGGTLATSVLGAGSAGCQIVCTQTYSCNKVLLGTYSVFFSITSGTFAGSAITNIAASETKDVPAVSTYQGVVGRQLQSDTHESERTFLGGGPESLTVGLRQNGIGLDTDSLRTALRNPKAEVRGLAGAQLASSGLQENIPYIQDALIVERDPLTKLNLALSLNRLDPKDGSQALGAVCTDSQMPDYIQLHAASYYLHSSGGTECNTRVVTIASTAPSFGLKSAAFSLFPQLLKSGVNPKKLKKILENGLMDTDPAVRIAAAKTAIEIFGDSASEMVQGAATREQDPFVKSSMQEALKKHE